MLDFACETWAQTPDDLGCGTLRQLKAKDRLQIIGFQLDEMWSFVGEKRNKAWIWVIYEPKSRQVIAFHLGGRGIDTARALWKKIPARIRHYCYFETDHPDMLTPIIKPVKSNI